MKVFTQDKNNDICMINNSLSFAKSKDAYGMIIADAIRTLTGEIQLDISLGIPYVNTVFESLALEPVWRTFVDERIRAFPFVEGVNRFTTSYNTDTKTLSYSITVKTVDGEVVLEG